MDGITAVLDISTLIYNGAAAENRNTTYIAKLPLFPVGTASLIYRKPSPGIRCIRTGQGLSSLSS